MGFMRPAEMTPLSVTIRTLLIPRAFTSAPIVLTDPGPMTIRGVVLNTLTIPKNLLSFLLYRPKY